MSGTQLEAAAAGAPNRCKRRLETCMACQVGGGHSLMLYTSRMHPSRNMDPPWGVWGGGGAPLEIVNGGFHGYGMNHFPLNQAGSRHALWLLTYCL